jgi:hypothetical protein
VSLFFLPLLELKLKKKSQVQEGLLRARCVEKRFKKVVLILNQRVKKILSL